MLIGEENRDHHGRDDPQSSGEVAFDRVPSDAFREQADEHRQKHDTHHHSHSVDGQGPRHPGPDTFSSERGVDPLLKQGRIGEGGSGHDREPPPGALIGLPPQQVYTPGQERRRTQQHPANSENVSRLSQADSESSNQPGSPRDGQQQPPNPPRWSNQSHGYGAHHERSGT